MGTVRFVIAIHNHQPVGNFENVFREAFEKCYEPFVKFLEDHPVFRVSLHNSGCLLDWLEGREKQFLKRLERLVRKNQVEMLSGGYYEPILPLVPERDAVNQMRFMNSYLSDRFGEKPAGFWLTERVWEQKIPRLSAQAGLQFTAVDDTHFALAGLPEREIKDLFITEEEGSPLYLFPIPKFLRYAIPFREPDETIRYLRHVQEERAPLNVVTYADDGEKFGLWPGTYQWVHRDGWLERFARALEENRSWITLSTFREALEERKGQPVRKVFLPSTSYEEMTEWALTREKGVEFSKLKNDLEASGLWDRSRSFFQGGTFKNFLFKYAEADWMRSRMMWASRRVAESKNPKAKEAAQRELWQGQCNCPYWHGVFGGLYLHHLRRSTYEHLIRSEESDSVATQKEPVLTEEDLNQDGAEETVIDSQPFSFYILPHRGGTIAELDFRPEAMNVLDVLTRRPEAYHGDLVKETGGGFESKGKSIHDLPKTVSAEVLGRLAFDRWNRLSFLDHFLPIETTLEDFWKSRFRSLIKDPTRVPFTQSWKKQKAKGRLSLTGEISLAGLPGPVRVEKNLEVESAKSEFHVKVILTNGSSERLECLWGEEWNFNFFDRERSETGVKKIGIQDGWSRVHVEIESEEACDYWQFPIETVSQTEADFRLIHQGISVFPHWRLALGPGESFERHLTFSFSSPRE